MNYLFHLRKDHTKTRKQGCKTSLASPQQLLWEVVEGTTVVLVASFHSTKSSNHRKPPVESSAIFPASGSEITLDAQWVDRQVTLNVHLLLPQRLRLLSPSRSPLDAF